jgi:hypothetical protein
MSTQRNKPMNSTLGRIVSPMDCVLRGLYKLEATRIRSKANVILEPQGRKRPMRLAEAVTLHLPMACRTTVVVPTREILQHLPALLVSTKS